MAFHSRASHSHSLPDTDELTDCVRRGSRPASQWAFAIWRKELRVALLLCAVTVGLLLPTVSKGQGQRPFGVRDSIERATFVADAGDPNKVSRFSPDGRYFFVITTRGILESNQMESTIWLFDTAVVSNALKSSSVSEIPAPRALAKMATISNGDPIFDARWAADSGSIAFLGRNRGAERHLFVLTLKDGRVRQLSNEVQDVTGFDCIKDECVFTTVPPVRDTELYQSAGPALPDIQSGTGRSIFSLLYPQLENSAYGAHPHEVWQVRSGKVAPVVESAGSAPLSLSGGIFGAMLSLSPNGRYCVVTNAAAHVPASWESYESDYRFSKIVADEADVKPTIGPLRPTQYNLMDLRNAKISVLINAPMGRTTGFDDVSTALWSPDGSEVILTNTYLPLEGGTASKFPKSTHPWVVAVDTASSKITAIRETPIPEEEGTSINLTDIEWQLPGRRLAFRYIDKRTGTAVGPELFQKENGAWKAIRDPAVVQAAASRSAGHEFSIAVHESLNEPPGLMAAEATTGRSKKIWDPNPQLAGVQLGEATIYKWRDKAGHEWTGGLLKSPDYVRGHRYPLVIQTHGFNERKFLADGSFPTAMAARPMAARGMLVLQVGEIPIPSAVLSTPQEVETVRGGYVAAIEQLDAEGMIDPHKVGIIGFSRTGWYVLNSLLHAKMYFAAATLAECTYVSFDEFILSADVEGASAKELASLIGPEPFGEGLQKWITDSAGFNTDKIDIPVFFEANSPAGLIGAWDLYGLMRLQDKPVELLYMRNGEHVLRKPMERLASQEMTVDWYDFWLKGHEDPDPAKAEQYARWRELRKLQEQNEAKSKQTNSVPPN